MNTKLQSTAEVNIRILASLEVGKWSYLNKISKELVHFNAMGEKTGKYVSGTRLKLNMTMLKDLGCVLDKDDWEKLTNQQREDYMKRDLPFAIAFKEKNVKNIYQITPKGTEKFKKIRDDCLDHITQRILHVHKKDDDE